MKFAAVFFVVVILASLGTVAKSDSFNRIKTFIDDLLQLKNQMLQDVVGGSNTWSNKGPEGDEMKQ
uniref:Uncharacterized protein n=1 Tax=Ciona intestinalis TaxID=7719 RepID=H2XNJ7_CIOIN